MSEIKVQISEELHTHLTAYLDLRLPIIPVCPPTTRGMSLSQREKYAKGLGKMPMIKGWVDRTETSYEEINEWLAKFKYCNFGLPMGNASGMVGVDIDGDHGEKLLSEWSKGELPSTWSFTTRAGRRILYAIPKGVRVKKFKDVAKDAVHEELALLGDGQQTVIPPSVHESGIIYEWEEGFSPWDIPFPAMAPKWVLDRMCEEIEPGEEGDPKLSEKVTEDEWKTELTEGSRSEQLVRLAGSLAARGNLPKDAILDFLRTWNQKNCKPPISDEELVRMVEYVVNSEKNSKKGKKAKNEEGLQFLPDPIAERIIDVESKKGYLWKYLPERLQFYLYDDTRGYWQICKQAYLEQRVRKYLIATEAKWGTVQRIRETVEAIKAQLMNPEDDELFDISRNPYSLINLQNGMLDLKTGDLVTHSAHYYSFLQLPVNWDPEAKCPEWHKALEEWLPDEDSRNFIQEYIGYCLTTDTSYKTAVFLNGGGNNGKSLFLHGISELFGDKARTAIPLHALSDRFTPAQLQDKLINVCDELDADHIGKTGVIKAIISGDPIKAEHKFGASFNFTPVAKLIFSTNTLPRATDRSEGWYSRLRIVNFPNNFAPNLQYRRFMHDKIQEELSGILVWAYEGLQRLNANGKFTNAAMMEQANNEYRAENDSVVGFANECLEEDENTNVEVADVYRLYTQYCNDNGLKAVARREFTSRIKNCGYNYGMRPIKGNYKRRAYQFLKCNVTEDFRQDFNFMKSLSVNMGGN